MSYADRFIPLRHALAFALLAPSIVAGCGDSTPAPTTGDAAAQPDGASQDVADAATPDAATPDAATPDAATDASSAMIQVRVAHLSPDAPAVDVCLRAAGASAFTGPAFAGLGAVTGLAYGQVTRYVELPAGTYTARLVAPGSANCDTALGGLPDVTLPMLAGGTRATVAAVGLLSGMGATAFRVVPIVDDATMPPAGSARLRFVHASPGTPAVDVGVPGMGTAFTTVFSNVSYPNAADAVNAPALMGASVAARVAGMDTSAGSYPLQLDGVDIPAGARITVFAVGGLNDDQTPLSALVCNDGASPTGLLTACNLLPSRIFVRVAHLSPDAPAVDVCVRPASATAWTGVRPTLASNGVAAGLSFPQVTRYVALPPGQYTVRLVAPASSNCDTALGGLPDVALPMLPAGTRATVAATGQLMGSGASAFTVRPIVDGNTRPALGRVHVRFGHFAPGAPNVDVGVVGTGGAFTSVFANVPYGSVANPMGSEMNTGYLPLEPINNATLQVRGAGSTSAVLTLMGVNVPATVSRGTAVSVFAIGLPSGSGNTRLSALVCTDRAPAMGPLAPCTRVP